MSATTNSHCDWECSGLVVECLTRDRGVAGFKPHQRHSVVALSKAH